MITVKFYYKFVKIINILKLVVNYSEGTFYSINRALRGGGEVRAFKTSILHDFNTKIRKLYEAVHIPPK